VFGLRPEDVDVLRRLKECSFLRPGMNLGLLRAELTLRLLMSYIWSTYS